MSATVWISKERQPGRLHRDKVAYVDIQDKEDYERKKERKKETTNLSYSLLLLNGKISIWKVICSDTWCKKIGKLA